MKQVFIGASIVMIIILAFAVFASAEDVSVLGVDSNADGVSDRVEKIVDEVSNPLSIADGAKKYIEEFVEKRGIEAEQVTNISEVNFEDLPKEVNIENVNDANLAIYQVNYNEDNSNTAADDKQIFVITYSTNELKEQGDLIIASDKREFLNFGYNGELKKSDFLKTATGVGSSLEKGYVMARKGSITAITTNLEIVKEGESVEIIVYKNGEAIMFGNTLDADSLGVVKDHDVQSKGVVTFEPGDVISAYVQVDGAVQDVITLVEITTTN